MRRRRPEVNTHSLTPTRAPRAPPEVMRSAPPAGKCSPGRPCRPYSPARRPPPPPPGACAGMSPDTPGCPPTRRCPLTPRDVPSHPGCLPTSGMSPPISLSPCSPYCLLRPGRPMSPERRSPPPLLGSPRPLASLQAQEASHVRLSRQLAAGEVFGDRTGTVLGAPGSARGARPSEPRALSSQPPLP